MRAPSNGMTSSYKQHGAVLYVALIMLILLALIGIIGMQVSGLQERMSANYSAVNIAFQNTEAVVRRTECAVEDLVNRTTTAGCGTVTPDIVCDNGFDAGEWANSHIFGAEAVNTRLIGPCISGNASMAMGEPVNEDPNPIYQITVYAADRAVADNPTADAAIDTIFRP